MQASTGPDDVKIKASGRTIKYLVTFADVAGGPVVADSFTVDRQFKDQPASINAFQGVGAAQATIVVPHSERLSPYRAAGQSVKLKSGVTVQVQIGGGTIFTRFTGLVTYVKVDAQGTATITALDYSVRGNVGNGPLQLCAAGVTGIAANSPDDLDLGISPLAVVDLALRAGGIYLSPQSVWATPTDRPKYLALSVPGGFGGYVPEVGYIGATHPSSVQRVAGKFGPDCLMTNDIRFYLTTNFPHIDEGISTTLCIEFWFRTLNGQPCQVMQIGGLILDLPSAGVGALLTASSVGATPQTYTTTTTLSDGNWHYARIVQQTQLMSSSGALGGVVTSITIDTNGPALVPSAGVPTFDPTLWDGLIIFGQGGANPIAIEGLEVVYYVGTPPTVPVRGPSATAPNTANLTLTTARMQAIPAQTATGWWQVIQDVAGAEGAVAWFDELGVLTYLPRLDLMAKRATAPVRTFTGSQLTGLVVSQTDDNVFGTVTASYRELKAVLGKSTGGTWALSADLSVPRGPVSVTQEITADPTFLVPVLTINNSDPVSGGTSHYSAVASTSVGDPAATRVPVQVIARPSANGFTLSIYNGNSFAVTFWSPGLQAPLLVINSWGLTVAPTPKVVTEQANPNIPDTLAIADSPWRQDAEITTILATSLAADTVVSVPVFDQVTIAGDPRIQLGDVVTVIAEPIMDSPALVMVVGIVDHGDLGNAYTQDLQLRAIGPATGWILGVPGRSELATTTLLTI